MNDGKLLVDLKTLAKSQLRILKKGEGATSKFGHISISDNVPIVEYIQKIHKENTYFSEYLSASKKQSRSH